MLGWSARKYNEWWGHKYSEGLTKRLGTKEPTIRVKSMVGLHNKAEGLPRNFNAIDKWSGYISDVPDQGKFACTFAYLSQSLKSMVVCILKAGVAPLGSFQPPLWPLIVLPSKAVARR